MSIWSTIHVVEPLHNVAYGWPHVGDDKPDVRSQAIADSYLELGTADAWYGREGLRISMTDGTREVEAVIDRAQAFELHAKLGEWLA